MIKNSQIPKEIVSVIDILENNGYEAYIVGGCVRDLIIGRPPKDWDIATNATPEQIIPLFPKAVYENNFGTVAVINEDEPLESKTRTVEITTYRIDGNYNNGRHPEKVSYGTNIEEDLARRDFTINALAYSVTRETLIDPFNGKIDLTNKILRAVGDPIQRFTEDGLRILRAIRFQAELGFSVSDETMQAIKMLVPRLTLISKERIRDEFIKIINSPNPRVGFRVAHETGVLPYFSIDLDNCFGVGQNKSHIYDVGTHLIESLQHGADKDYSFQVKLAALFHDVGKPATKRREGHDFTFYGHEVVGAKITKKTLTDMKFDKRTIENVFLLVRYHMFFSDPDQITLSAVRRLIANVGPDLIWELVKVRYCDRIGMGRPKEDPYRLRYFESMIEEALRDPISVKMLKINGETLINQFHMKPGPKMGYILNILLEEVLDDPNRNTIEYLGVKVNELINLSDEELKTLAENAKKAKEDAESTEIQKLRQKHHVG